MASSLRDVIDQMASVGLHVPAGHELLVTNGSRWVRFKPDNSHWKRGKEAYYCIWERTFPNGKTYYFGIFGIGAEQYKIEKSQKAWTADEWQQIEARRQEEQDQIEKSIEQKHLEAAQKATKMWHSAKEQVSLEHPYVSGKKIKPVGARQLRNQIIIPLYRDKKIVGLQTIFPGETVGGKTEIEKKFLTGSDTKGSYAPLGKFPEKPEVIFVVEGWATGCTVYEATQKPVVVAFNAGNIYPVVESLRKNFPDTKICIAADNDCHYDRKLIGQLKDKYNFELIISASAKVVEKQIVETPEGKAEFRAYWSKVDNETTLVYSYKLPGQQKASQVKLQNTGEIKARRAAYKFGACVLLPRFTNAGSMGTDFNDLASEEGIEVVKRQLNWQEAQPLRPPTLTGPKRTDKASKNGNSEIIKYLGDRYIAIDSTDTLWDVEQQRITKISTVKQWYESSIVTNWLRDAFHNRRIIQPEQLVFEPDPAKIPEGCISTFSGWPLKPIPGECSLIKDHLMKMCGENDSVFDWVVKWLAYPLQHPGAKMQTALIIYGEREGTGKSLFFDVMKRIYGRYACSVNQSAMSSDFNGWISRRLFVVAEEVFTSADRRHQKGGLKNLVTNSQHIINEKGLPIRFEVNKTNLVFLSNELPPLALDQFDRRYMAIKFNEPSSHQYFADLIKEIDNGGVEAFYDFLLHYDLEDFCESTAIINTDAHKELKLLSGDSMPRFLEHWLAGDTNYPVGPVPIQYLYKAYKMWALTAGERFNASRDFMCKRLRTIMFARRMRVRHWEDGSMNSEVKDTVEKQHMVYFPGIDPQDAKDAVQIPTDEINNSTKKFQEVLWKEIRSFKNNEMV